MGWWSRFCARRLEIALVVAAVGVAMAVRLPYLTLVPRFQDEGVDVLWALDIATGKRLPSTGADPYYGPLFSYIVALLFRLLGRDVVWPRALAAVFGALTVSATYYLGRITGGRRVGLLASLLVLGSRSLIAVSSHFGWSNSLSPFFATATLLAWCEAYRTRRARWLVAAGLLSALTIQTHPISATIVVAIGVWMLVPSGLLSRAKPSRVAFAIAACLLAYAPVLWPIVTRDVSIIGVGQARSYAFVPAASFSIYLARLARLCHVVWLATFSGVPPYGSVTTLGGVGIDAAAAMSGPWAGWSTSIAVGGLLVLGGICMRRRIQRILGVVLLVSLALIPLVIQAFPARYINYLLPIVFIGVAETAAWIASRLHARVAPLRRVATAPVAAVAVVAMLPLLSLDGYYRELSRVGGSNAAFLDLPRVLQQNDACQVGVVLEVTPEVSPPRENTWSYFNREAIEYVLTMSGCRFEMDSSEGVHNRIAARTARWVIASDATVSSAPEGRELSKVLGLSPGPVISRGQNLALYFTTGDIAVTR